VISHGDPNGLFLLLMASVRGHSSYGTGPNYGRRTLRPSWSSRPCKLAKAAPKYILEERGDDRESPKAGSLVFV